MAQAVLVGWLLITVAIFVVVCMAGSLVIGIVSVLHERRARARVVGKTTDGM